MIPVVMKLKDVQAMIKDLESRSATDQEDLNILRQVAEIMPKLEVEAMLMYMKADEAMRMYELTHKKAWERLPFHRAEEAYRGHDFWRPTLFLSVPHWNPWAS